ALTAVFSWKQFHGPPNEWTIQQAELGRQIARGQGFTTLVNYPQTYAVLKARWVKFDENRPYPELHHAPLYPLALAAVFALLPQAAWRHIPDPPGGWAPDYAILVLNLALFWVGVWLAWRLARRLFDERAAMLTAVATASSVTLWQQTVVVSGMPLLLVLLLAIFNVLAGFEEQEEVARPSGRARLVSMAWLGALGALMFLTEYSAGLVLPALGCYLAWRLASSARWPALGVLVGTAVLLIAPWLIRNTVVVGHPLGLAWQNLALKADDSTALPSVQRNLLSTEPPGLDLKKLGNKGLTGMELNLKERIWSGGGLLLCAFFVSGLAYQFRHAPANRVRWAFAAVMLVLLTVQPFFGSGESPRLPAYYLAPLVIVFGAGFFFVLVDSQAALAQHWKWVMWGLLLVQAFPLVRDCLEPRKIHFHYPPYFPNLFMELGRDARTRFLPGTGYATDVPAGTAWYGQMRVWSKPERLRDFYAITVEQNIGALLLTPVTLDRPFFAELAARREDAIQLTDASGWGGVYTGLVTRRMPMNFPLNLPPQRLTDNMVLLVNPNALGRRGN
ncbi:MAG: ArnT family glycosyltransferase, partial [Opitutales bacterium]